MAKLTDIAKAAGVSPSTVSNALNGRNNVSREMREKILKLCKEMEYQPNPAGRSLKKGDNKTILFNFTDFDRQFCLDIIHGINDCVTDKGYDLITCTNTSYEKFMNKTLTCGSIILDIRCSNNFLLKRAAGGYPIVTLDRRLDLKGIKNVLINNYDPEYELVEGLVQKGYRHFAFLAGQDTDDSRERYQAFKDVLDLHRIAFRQEDYYAGDWREKSGYRVARLIMMQQKLPEILVCASDSMAIGALRAFYENNIKVPDRIAVCGFDGAPFAKTMNLTTVNVPNYERGYLGAQYLIENINGSDNYDTVFLTAKTVWGGTTR